MMAGQGEQRYRSWVEVDLDNYRHNWAEVRRLVGPNVRILQVVKADAYGHGAIEISNEAMKNGASFLGVANADEGVQLRVGDINAPIVILSPATYSEVKEIIKYNLTPSVSDIHFARELERGLEKAGKRLPVHIEVDTGMGRGGTIYSEALPMIQEILGFPHISVEGIFTHLSSSEVEDDTYNQMQWEHFSRLLSGLDDKGIRIPIRHMSNSGGVLNFPRFNLDMVRPGIMTYGIYPGESTVSKAHLVPVMSFKTSVVLLKDFPGGYGIGYGRTYVTGGPTRIATIPVGYGDGYGVILSNQGEALVRGKRAPVVGRVSMDMCTLDVSHIPECEVGDEVVLLGRQGEGYISANEIAAKAKTISYEVICALGKRAPRVFVNQGKAGSVEPRLRRIFIPDEEKSIARIDGMIRRCFQAKTRSEELGDAIYYEMIETLFGKEDRQLELRTHFRYDVHVKEFSEEEKAVDGSVEDYLKVATNVEYTKTLRNDIFLIGCAMNNRHLAALFADPRCEYRWLLNEQSATFKESDFKVERVSVDGEGIPIIRTEKTDRGFEVWCGGDFLNRKLGSPVRVKIEITTKKLKSSNVFSVFLVYPTRGLEISFNYAGTRIRNVREVSFFSGRRSDPEVVKTEGKSVSIRVGDRDWIFPTSGVIFIWDL
ncbi:MAG TPA: alanine racemase [Syntrophales bacterium]|nr:alanine racemase [Syntrophales bacterium]HRT71076.1 alanine racemase [Syntrophales bacterium]